VLLRVTGDRVGVLYLHRRQAAFRRERQIKELKRVWKLEMIEKSNPGWTDLWDGFWTLDGV